MYKSQGSRNSAPEIDPIWLGTGWMEEDLAKPQILLESSYGESHPGSQHLNKLVEEARIGVYKAGGKPSIYTVTDICDGVATGHNGMNYSLVSRDIISAMVEIHAMCVPFDGLVTFSSCDKSIPAHLMALARLDRPSIHVCGGSMAPGPDFISAEICYETNDKVKQGKMTLEEQRYYQKYACPSNGACQYMGTANTMQMLSEALGMSLPGNALMPGGFNLINRMAHRAGQQVLELLRKGITAKQVLTRKAFENAMMLHAAVSGSTNALLHLPAIAKDVGISLDPAELDEIHRKIPVLVGLKTSGPWPTQILWYAGGVPGLMLAIKEYLHLDALTVTGKTVEENLEDLEQEGFFQLTRGYLKNYGLKPEDIIMPLNKPYSVAGGLAILKGNLAPEGAAVKHSAVPSEMQTHIGPAKPFDSEEQAIEAIQSGQINPGDVILIRYEGPKGAGIPEMLKTTEAIYNRPELVSTTALVTDGRFSGATRGPAIGHVTPEGALGGPIALVEENDVIRIDIPNRVLEIIGSHGKQMSEAEVSELLTQRKEKWVRPPSSQASSSGVLNLFTKTSDLTKRGASIF